MKRATAYDGDTRFLLYLVSKPSEIDQENLQHWDPHTIEVLEQAHERLQCRKSDIETDRQTDRQTTVVEYDQGTLAHLHRCFLMGVCLSQVAVALSERCLDSMADYLCPVRLHDSLALSKNSLPPPRSATGYSLYLHLIASSCHVLHKLLFVRIPGRQGKARCHGDCIVGSDQGSDFSGIPGHGTDAA
eukprot:748760-Hanusia_phi.AAC.1